MRGDSSFVGGSEIVPINTVKFRGPRSASRAPALGRGDSRLFFPRTRAPAAPAPHAPGQAPGCGPPPARRPRASRAPGGLRPREPAAQAPALPPSPLAAPWPQHPLPEGGRRAPGGEVRSREAPAAPRPWGQAAAGPRAPAGRGGDRPPAPSRARPAPPRRPAALQLRRAAQVCGPRPEPAGRAYLAARRPPRPEGSGAGPGVAAAPAQAPLFVCAAPSSRRSADAAGPAGPRRPGRREPPAAEPPRRPLGRAAPA